MKIKMTDNVIINNIKNYSIIDQCSKIIEEIEELFKSLENNDNDMENIFEECNDVQQAVHTLQILICEKNKLNKKIIKAKNKKHIRKIKKRIMGMEKNKKECRITKKNNVK